MREFNRERFMQLLHEVPESKPFFHEPRHNPYTLSPDCCTPDIFLNTFVNLILYCQREVERIEAVEADERNAVAYIGKEAA